MSFYSVYKVQDLTHEIVESLLSPNAFDLRISHPDVKGFKYAVLEYDNLPVDLLKEETAVLSASEIQEVLATDPIWGEIAPFSIDSVSPWITNLSLPVPDTEVEHTMQASVSELIVRSRVKVTLKFAFVSTESGTNYITLNPGAVLTLKPVQFNGRKMYIQADKVTTVEILEVS